MNTSLKVLTPTLLFLIGGVSYAQAERLAPQQKPAAPAKQEQAQPREQRDRQDDWPSRLERRMNNFFGDFFSIYPFSRGSDAHHKEVALFDSQSVKMPQIVVHEGKEDRKISIEVKGLSVNKDQIKAEFDEERGIARFSFPYQEGDTQITIGPDGIEVSAQMNITEEKKDPKGTVLKSSSYKAYNSYAQSFRYPINPGRLLVEYKDGTLLIISEPREVKRNIVIK